ncbi:hypothetical protein GSY69_06055 [Brevibacterium sp. 5221]|uniref:Uncharacterized protein n=1 Tax=Brevibacterium rongguiense TaxID=2695267 RepID=A0A6N9H6G9_9MICO|nr:hypothetical protein [Brevibacterium rongguiense]MYM19543.1 hypothetical protein [Brevibacterium rongguiense]
MQNEQVRVRGKLARNPRGRVFVRAVEPRDQAAGNSVGGGEPGEDVDFVEEAALEAKWVQVEGLPGVEKLTSPWVSITGFVNRSCTAGSAGPTVMEGVVDAHPRPDELMRERLELVVGEFAALELSDLAWATRVTIADRSSQRDITRHVDELERYSKTVDHDGVIDCDVSGGGGYVGGVGFCVNYAVPIVTDELREYLKTVNAKVALVPIVQRRRAGGAGRSH